MDDINTNKQFRIYDINQKYIRLSVDETIARGLNKWENWQCSAGIRGLYIDFDGNVWICNTASAKLDRFNDKGWQEVLAKNTPAVVTEEWYSVVKKQLGLDYRKTKDAFKKILENTDDNKMQFPGFLGNIFDGFDLPSSWFKCPWQSCGCGADVILSKARSAVYKTLLTVTHNAWEGKEASRDNVTDNIEEPVAVEMNFPIPYQVLWDLGRRCNYDCSYCWPAVHNRTDDHKQFDILINTTNDLINRWADKQAIRWNFGGGEPTLHPQFLELLKHLKNHKQWTMVTSNGTRDHKYWSNAVENLNSINLSAHFDGLKDDRDEERFVKNIEVICQHFDDHDDDHWLEIKLMAPPRFIERALALGKRIRNLETFNTIGANGRIKGALSLVPIRSMGDSGELVFYAKEQLEIFKNQ